MHGVYVRKVQQQGNQRVINVPYDVCRFLNVTKGSHIYFICNEETGKVEMGEYDPLAKGRYPGVGDVDRN